AKARAEQAEREEWARRFVQARRDDWDIAAQLRVRALEMLSWPLEETVETTASEDGRSVTVVRKPALWRASDVPAFLKVAGELMACVERSFLPVTDAAAAPIEESVERLTHRPTAVRIHLNHGHSPL